MTPAPQPARPRGGTPLRSWIRFPRGKYERAVPVGSSSFIPFVSHELSRTYAEFMTFGARLRECRKAKHLSQEQLGQGLGTDGKDCTKAVVSGWERGEHFPRVDQLILICQRI